MQVISIYFFINVEFFSKEEQNSKKHNNFFQKKFKKVYTFTFSCAIIIYMEKENYKKVLSNANADDQAVVAGRNAVLELLVSGRSIEKLYLQKDGEGSLKKIVALAKEKRIPVSYADKQKLTALAGGSFHQGAVAMAQQKEYATLDRLFEIAEERGEKPFFVIADGVEDPHNLGALIRCCEGAGAHGIIIPKNKAVGLTPTVIKSSAGAAEHLAVCRVTNLASTIDQLRERGVWVYACEADGTPYDKQDFSGAIAVVLGSEGFGISRLVKEKSDFIISLPMRGKVNSLNVSCAGAVILYEAAKYR